jgi:quinoprotein glucose dehydrogenase
VPIWPIVEKPVPQSTVPGEKTAPTQPHPPEKLRYARNWFKVPDDLIDFTPELRAQALERSKRFTWAETPFNPGILGDVNGMIGAIVVGTATNWPGGGYDPENHIAFAPAANMPGIRSVVAPPPGFSDIRYVAGTAGQAFQEVLGPGDCCAADSPRTAARAADARAQAAAPPPAAPAVPAANVGLNVQGLPMIKPPYGLLSAVNLDRGELMWQTPHGDTPDAIRLHPALKGMTIPKTGQPGVAGVGLLVTKTLVIMGDPQITAPPGRQRGAMLRAYNKMNGQQVGEVWMPAPQSGSPMTYRIDGKQYIVVAISGGPYSGEYVAFAAPSDAVTTSK